MSSGTTSGAASTGKNAGARVLLETAGRLFFGAATLVSLVSDSVKALFYAFFPPWAFYLIHGSSWSACSPDFQTSLPHILALSLWFVPTNQPELRYRTTLNIILFVMSSNICPAEVLGSLIPILYSHGNRSDRQSSVKFIIG